MKKSILLPIFIFAIISCGNDNPCNYIINKWQLIEIQFDYNDPESYDSRNDFLSEFEEYVVRNNPAITDEEIGKELKIESEKILSGIGEKDTDIINFKEKNNIEFTEDGEYLDHKSKLKGTYQLSLDCRKIVITNKYKRVDTLYVIKLTENELELKSEGCIRLYKVK